MLFRVFLGARYCFPLVFSERSFLKNLLVSFEAERKQGWQARGVVGSLEQHSLSGRAALLISESRALGGRWGTPAVTPRKEERLWGRLGPLLRGGCLRTR